MKIIHKVTCSNLRRSNLFEEIRSRFADQWVIASPKPEAVEASLEVGLRADALGDANHIMT